MGVMDKLAERVKDRAGHLAEQAQHGMAQGQAKLTAMQLRKQADILLRDLGAAVYAAQRQGGPHEPIETAMAALDAHVAAHGSIDLTRSAPPPPPPPEPQTGGF